MNKPKIFTIIPFNAEGLELYEELKKTFESKFEFIRAGELNSNQNILKDIICGIENAQVVLADLTGHNPNVFYELGLAHAMQKKVIMITQEIDKLPFDIKIYKAINYSLHYKQINNLKKELEEYIEGAINGTIEYSNPYTDFAKNASKLMTSHVLFNNETPQAYEEKGFLDYLDDINIITKKINTETHKMNNALNEKSNSISTMLSKANMNNKTDISNIRAIFKRCSKPVSEAENIIKNSRKQVTLLLQQIEGDYTGLLENKSIFMQVTAKEIQGVIEIFKKITPQITSFQGFEETIEQFSLMEGIEKNFTKSVNNLKSEMIEFKKLSIEIQKTFERMIDKSLLFQIKLESKEG